MPIEANDRWSRLAHLSRSKGLDGVLCTNPATIKCLSGFFYNFETGPSPFQFLPAALLVQPFERSSLLIAEDLMDKLTGINPEVQLSSYTSYAYTTPLHYREDFLSKIVALLKENKVERATLGIERSTFPFHLFEVLQAHLPAIKWIDITDEISLLRAVKDSEGLEGIRQAVKLADIGQEAVVRYAREGMTELELFSKVRLAMETAAGMRLPIMTDLVCGAATANGGGNPTNRVISDNELVLSDLTPCFNGYWGDSCNTVSVGTPTQEQTRLFSLVQSALAAGIEKVRPGVQAKEVDATMRAILESEGGFGHHGGHGVGVQYHEEPRITPYNTMILEPGMVIALEPGVYKETYGIRLEHMVVVTSDGCELLTRFKHQLEQNGI